MCPKLRGFLIDTPRRVDGSVNLKGEPLVIRQAHHAREEAAETFSTRRPDKSSTPTAL
jgi:hypothetical protein